MRSYIKYEVKISIWTAINARLTLSTQSDIAVIINTSRYFYLKLYGFSNSSGTLTIRTRSLDSIACSMAMWASCNILESAKRSIANLRYLSASATSLTCLLRSPWRGSFTITSLTLYLLCNLDFLLAAEYCFKKINSHSLLDILTLLWTIPASTSATTAKASKATEHVEDIFKTTAEAAKPSARASAKASAWIYAGMTESVISALLLGV